MKWLEGTFFFVRFRLNPQHYKLHGSSTFDDLEDCIRQVCGRNLDLLQDYSLITHNDKFNSTELGDAMARYHLQFDTMKIFLGLPKQAKMSEIVSDESFLRTTIDRLHYSPAFSDGASRRIQIHQVPVGREAHV